MQDVAVNGEDGGHSSFQAPRPTTSLTLSYFPTYPPPLLPPHRHLHAAVEFSLPFISFPFLQTLAIWYASQYICCAAFTVAPCWGLQRAAHTPTHSDYSKLLKHKNRISFFLKKFIKKMKQKCWTVTDLSLWRSSMALANASSERRALSSAACALCSSASWVPGEWTEGSNPSSPHSSSRSAQ